MLYEVITLINAYVEMWKRAFDFGGVSGRKVFWYAVLINFIIGLILGIIGILALSSLYSLLAFVPGLSLGIRRMRDIGKSPFFVLLALIPIAGIFIYIYYAAQPTDKYVTN